MVRTSNQICVGTYEEILFWTRQEPRIKKSSEYDNFQSYQENNTLSSFYEIGKVGNVLRTERGLFHCRKSIGKVACKTCSPFVGKKR